MFHVINRRISYHIHTYICHTNDIIMYLMLYMYIIYIYIYISINTVFFCSEFNPSLLGSMSFFGFSTHRGINLEINKIAESITAPGSVHVM